MDEKIIIKGLDLGFAGFAVAIYKNGADEPAYMSAALNAGDCARALIHVAGNLKAMGCPYQVQVCERLADAACYSLASLN